VTGVEPMTAVIRKHAAPARRRGHRRRHPRCRCSRTRRSPNTASSLSQVIE
jgi:hypothetical protein